MSSNLTRCFYVKEYKDIEYKMQEKLNCTSIFLCLLCVFAGVKITNNK